MKSQHKVVPQTAVREAVEVETLETEMIPQRKENSLTLEDPPPRMQLPERGRCTYREEEAARRENNRRERMKECTKKNEDRKKRSAATPLAAQK